MSFFVWLMLLEDVSVSQSSVRDSSPHIRVFKEFRCVSYAKRYKILCLKLVQEQLYTAASIITSCRMALGDDAYSELNDMTGLHTFVTGLGGHFATEVARS